MATVKRTPVDEYRLSNRGGKGIKTATITERNGNIVCITTVTGEEDLMVVTNAGVIIRLDVEDISQNGRAAGCTSMRLGEGQFVSTVAKVKRKKIIKQTQMILMLARQQLKKLLMTKHLVMLFIQKKLKM